MRTTLLLVLLAALLTPRAEAGDEFPATGATFHSTKGRPELWYTFPATASDSKNPWMEYSLPIGNGQLGASLMGGIRSDEIQFNEKTLWSGKSDIGDYGSYQNFGSLRAEFLGSDRTFSSYLRTLSLDSAMASVSFRGNTTGTAFTRQYFASCPDRCIVARYQASEPAMLALRFTLTSGKPGVDAETSYSDGGGSFAGRLDAISYCARFRVIPIGNSAKVETDASGVTVTAADEIVVILTGATDFDPYSPTYISGTSELPGRVSATVDAAAKRGFAKLLKRHLADYMPIFSRTKLRLGGEGGYATPTNLLIDKYDEGRGAGATTLEALYFAYGRYLEISSSRGIDLPSNLQGIWNNSSTPPWNSDIHSNINVQMNYWPAEPANMSEMHMPFLNYIINMSTAHKEWQRVARDAGQTRGWTVYTENNNMGGMGAFAHNYVIANAWYATHLWQHYRYTLDRKFLLRAFPAMWSAAEFWIERLRLAPDGTYECPNEYSPEQGPSENATAHSQQLVSELLRETQAAAAELGKDCGVGADSLAILADRIAHLDSGLRTEEYDGAWGEDRIPAGTPILREWKYSPYSVGEPGHRHSSHLMCLYPFSQITTTSPLLEAAVNSMRLRGDESTGWSMGWKINLWARAHDGNRAHAVLTHALRHSRSYGVNQYAGGIYYNLYDSHAPFQIDGNFGACAGIAEMLLQCPTDTLQLLPALPGAWRDGEVTGLKAAGDFTVSISWQDGKPVIAKITSNQGRPLFVSYPGIALCDVKIGRRKVSVLPLSPNTIRIPARRAGHVTIDFSSHPGEL